MLGHVWPTLKCRGLSRIRGSEVKTADLWPIVCFTELEAKSMLDKLLAAELLDIVVLLKDLLWILISKSVSNYQH